MTDLWFAVLVFVLAGLVKGVVGLGLPTVAMALLALFMPPAEAAALLVVPSLATNFWQMRPWGEVPALARRLGPMLVGVVLGTLAVALCFGVASASWGKVALGVALIVYALWSLGGATLSVPARREGVVGVVVGVVTGAVTAVTGVFAIPAVPYMQALGLERDALIRAMGLSFSVSTLALAGGLLLGWQYAVSTAGQSLLLLLPALAGMELGRLLRQRLSPAVFRRCLLLSLLALGLYMLRI